MVASARLVAATNKDLLQLVKKGEFREDLYYRLNVVPIHMPPLRDRREDVPLLASAFLKEFAQENKKSVNELEPAAVEALIHYSWPGNVRELRAAIERAVVLSRGGAISLRDLPPTVRGAPSLTPPSPAPGSALPTAAQSIEEAEKQVIIHGLKETGGNRTEAARKLGMSRRTLHRKIKTYGLEGY
jgi:DNA-binding NtrC family response regulator